MRKTILIVLVLLLLLLCTPSSAIDIYTGKTETKDTSVTLSDGVTTFASKTTGLSVTTEILIDGNKFTPLTTKEGSVLEWSNNDISFEFQYTGTKIKEIITLQKDYQLSFPVSTGYFSKLIPWDNGQWKIVSSISWETMNGIVLEKPFGIDAKGRRIEMEYAYKEGVLNLEYERSITEYEFKQVTEIDNKTGKEIVVLKYLPVVSEITYPLVIDPTWVSWSGHFIDNTTNSTHTVEMWNATGSTTWTPPAGVFNVEYLVVAGGGGGGLPLVNYDGGGGGSGALRTAAGLSVTPGTGVTVTVGSGGVGGNSATNGNNSVFSSITSIGGGYGGKTNNGNGADGGSGGGGADDIGTHGHASDALYGNNGGDSVGAAAGGGGGVGGTGGNGIPIPSYIGGAGGAGTNAYATAFCITANSGYLAAGGGGGAYLVGGTGGSGIGGNGGKRFAPPAPATSGAPNTGSGGGGATTTTTAGSGGSGIVIIKYATPINASFTAAPTTGLSPLTVQFTNTSSTPASSWQWNYTALGSSVPVTFNTTANPIQSFTTGNYSIKLRAYNSFTSNISTQTTWINVSPGAPVSDFYYSDGITCINALTLFWDLSTESPTSWYWDFGDNATSTDQNPTHVYTSTGLYTVKLKATNAIGFDWENKTNYVNVTVCPEQEQGRIWCGLQTLYFGHQPSPDITGYEQLNNYPTGISEVDENITVKNTLGYVLLDTYISPVGSPGVDTLLSGLRRYRAYHYVSTASGVTVVNYTFFVRNHHGVEATLYSVETADINDLTVAEQLTSYVAPIDFNLALDDRIGVKIYGKTDHSANVILHFVYEGEIHTSHKVSGYFVCPQALTATPTPTPAPWTPVMNPSTDVKPNYGAMIRQWWWLPVLIAIICLLLRRR